MIPKIDISPEDWIIVESILEGFVPQQEVWAFGSRARWTAKNYSDLDVVILGDEPLSEELLMDLEKNFIESDLPWKVDIVDWHNLDDDFKNIIEKDHVVIRERNTTKWPSVRLDSTLMPNEKISYGVVQPGKETLNGVPIVRVSDLRNGIIDTTKPLKISKQVEASYLRTRLTGGELLLSIVGTVGETAIVPEALKGWNIARAIARIPVREDVNARWVQLALKTNTIKQLINSKLNTTVQPTLNLRDVAELPIPLPSKEERFRILKILNALDDKIDLNRRTNRTLEAMARALFRDWFVDFGPTRAKMAGQTPYLAPEIWTLFPDRLDDEGKPEGWDVTTLGNLAETYGENISPEEVEPETPYVGLEHLPRQSLALTDWGTADKVTSGKTRFVSGNILFGKLRPYFHKVVIAPMNGICSTDIVVIDSKKKLFRSIVRLLCSSEDFVEFTDRTSQGTKMPRTSWAAMRSYELPCIPDDVAAIFEDFVSPNFFKIERNIRESRSLAQLRDLLLPKLMSGEIRIQDAEKMVADAL